jgi:hypothetical protein
MTRRLAVVLALLFTSPLGCASGATARIGAKNAQYPISLSQSFVDASGKSYTPSEDEIVGRARFGYTQWSMFWDQVPLNGPLNFGAILDRKIERASGDAIVNLTVTSTFGRGYLILSLLPFIPDSARIYVRGDIVRVASDPSE